MSPLPTAVDADEIAQFLHTHTPFHVLPLEKLQAIAPTINVEHFPAEYTLLEHDGEPAEYLYIIRKGSVDLLRAEGTVGETLFDTLGEGDIFGHPSLIREHAPDVTIRSREELIAYLVPAATFYALRRDYTEFARFFNASSLERLTQRLEVHDAVATTEFRTHLRALLRPVDLYVDPQASVRDIAHTMRERQLDCVIVNTEPPGIVTDRDLRNRVLAEGLSDATPVQQVMTAPILVLPADSEVFEGLMTMIEQRIRHLPITEDGRVIGVITHTDILRQQSSSPLLLPRQLLRARDLEDLRGYTRQVTEAVGAMLNAGARIYDIGRMVAVAHDALLERLLRDAEAECGPPPCPYAWLVLGSEGRYEQTLRTDQDNALVYADDAPPDADDYFAQLAERVVENLVVCGFPRCPGDIMATNPQWRQPLRVWQTYFTGWIDVPDEEALMRAAIFFDFRRVYGNLNIEQMLRPIIQEARHNGIFLSRLSKGALRQSPPLSFFRGLAVERDGAGRNVIDLKVRGTALIVDLARLFAIAAGLSDTNTLTRLKKAAQRSDLSDEGSDELAAAFELISQIRLRHQYAQLQRDETPTNLVEVETLSPYERRELKEALRAVGRIQRSVETLFGTRW